MIKINFTYFYISVCESENVSCSVMSDSLSPYGQQPARLLCPWDSPGKNPGVDCSAPQGIFLTQGSNLGLLHYRQILYHLSHQGSPVFICLYTQYHFLYIINSAFLNKS